MKFVILDNTAWTTHFVVLQSISRAAETASVASRRTTERLVRWTHPTSSLPPSSLYVRAAVCDDTLRAPLQIFFRSALTEIPVRRMRELHSHLCAPQSMQSVRCTQPCTIVVHVRRLSHFSTAETTTPACCGRRSLPNGIPNGDRYAARANQKVSQSSAPPVAAACAGAAAAATGLRGAAAAARFGGASRSSRAAATGTATAAEGARGA